MRQLLFSSLLLCMLGSACKSKKTDSTDQQQQTNQNDTTTFYDIKSVFNSDVEDIKATPYFIYTTINIDGKKKDSMPINNSQFFELAQQFINKDITNKEIKHFYKEDLFRDLSTKSLVFNYTSTKKDLEIQSINVLLDDESNKVKYIFIRTNKATSDSTVSTQLYWTKGKSFQINTSVIKNDGTKYTTQQYVNWNDNDK